MGMADVTAMEDQTTARAAGSVLATIGATLPEGRADNNTDH